MASGSRPCAISSDSRNAVTPRHKNLEPSVATKFRPSILRAAGARADKAVTGGRAAWQVGGVGCAVRLTAQATPLSRQTSTADWRTNRLKKASKAYFPFALFPFPFRLCFSEAC